MASYFPVFFLNLAYIIVKILKIMNLKQKKDLFNSYHLSLDSNRLPPFSPKNSLWHPIFPSLKQTPF
jgi:hypothetical protein